MKETGKEKFIHEVEAGNLRLTSAGPFKVQREDKRAFVRLEISAPASIQPLRNDSGELDLKSSLEVIKGVILNLSAGGILVELESPLREGDVVSMRFTLQGDVTLENILGLVKRCEVNKESMIAGIEFLTEERISDLFSAAEIEILTERFTDFNAGLNALLRKYVRIASSSTPKRDRYAAR